MVTPIDSSEPKKVGAQMWSHPNDVSTSMLAVLLWFHPTGALVCANRTHGSCPSALGALVAFGEAKGVTITAIWTLMASSHSLRLAIVPHSARNAKSVVAGRKDGLIGSDSTRCAGRLVGCCNLFTVLASTTLSAGKQRRGTLCGAPSARGTICTGQWCSGTLGWTPLARRTCLANLLSICASLHAPCSLGAKLARCWL